MSQGQLVRGGSPTEVSFIIDNIPMPGVKHFPIQDGGSNGTIGIVNTELISGISFYTGGFSPSFGDYMSAAAGIRYREGSRTGCHGDFYLSIAGFEASPNRLKIPLIPKLLFHECHVSG